MILRLRGQTHRLQPASLLVQVEYSQALAACRGRLETRRRVLCAFLGAMWADLRPVWEATQQACLYDVWAVGESIASTLLAQGYSLAEVDDIANQVLEALAARVAKPAAEPEPAPPTDAERLAGYRVSGRTWAEYAARRDTTGPDRRTWADLLKAVQAGTADAWMAEHGEAKRVTREG